jgi:hypothetical protein
MGGYTDIYELDFIDNKYSYIGYLPEDGKTPELNIKSTFTDDKEKVFMDYCYSYGLFDLKESYTALFPVMDGGGWYLIIEYEDGSTKTSKGSNAGPSDIFNKCSTVFYDLCGEPIVGRLPDYYVYPPNVSYSFRYQAGNTNVNTNEIAKVVRANYKWNKFENLDNNIYSLTESNENKFNDEGVINVTKIKKKLFEDEPDIKEEDEMSSRYEGKNNNYNNESNNKQKGENALISPEKQHILTLANTGNNSNKTPVDIINKRKKDVSKFQVQSESDN